MTNAPTTGLDIRALVRSSGLGLFLAVVWVLVAWWRPGATYHLAPPLIAGAVPFLYATEADPRPSWLWLLVVGDIGTVIAVIVSVVIWLLGWMEGPALWPFGDVLVESIVLAVGGGIVGWLLGLYRVSAA